MEECSVSKDTTAGHWEMMNVVIEKPFARYLNGFPPEIMELFETKTKMGWIGNFAASGTEILESMGEEHLRTGKVIVYTSADSVFQIAAHVDVVAPEKLYEICKITRAFLDEYQVGRVIARPFAGVPGKFVRLNNKRHDYSMKPTGRTLLEEMVEKGIETVSVGKIIDIFTGIGISRTIHTDNNADGMKKLKELQTSASDKSFVFANLVDFDALFGHRRELKGYYNALKDFDNWLGSFLNDMPTDDFLIITADHGCDPSFKGTDHTREQVPFIIYSPSYKNQENLGTQKGFSFSGFEAMKALGI